MEKVTVVSCEESGVEGHYDVLLSNGETMMSKGAYPIGAEYVSEPAAAEAGINCDVLSITFDVPGKAITLRMSDTEGGFVDHKMPLADAYSVSGLAAIEDNAMLQRALDEANATIASMQTQAVIDGNTIERLKQRQGVAPIPASLTNVQTRDVADLPTLDQLPPHPTLDPDPAPGVMPDDDGTSAANEAAQLEGAKP